MKRPWGGLFDFYFHSLGVMVKKKSFQKQHTHLYKLLCLYSECLSRPIKMCLNAFFNVCVGWLYSSAHGGIFLVVCFSVWTEEIWRLETNAPNQTNR